MIERSQRNDLLAMFFSVAILSMTCSLAKTAELSQQKSNSQSTFTRFLVLDSQIIDKTSNAQLTLGQIHKHPQNPLFEEEKPWEPHFSNMYPNVIYDEQEKLYKCWYSPFIINKSCSTTPRSKRIPGNKNYISRIQVQRQFENAGREMAVCYAISADGIKWKKPELDIIEFNGSKKNNIVFRHAHGAGVFKDLHEKDATKRYKMVFLDIKSRAIHVAFSPDGIHWSKSVSCPEAEVRGDTHNNALWEPELGKYVLFSRLRPKDKGRVVSRSESPDFLKWTKGQIVLSGIDITQQIYSMPVFRYAGIYLGLPTIYNTNSTLPAGAVWPDRAPNLVHTELAWSPDTINWHHIKPGIPLISNSRKWWGRNAYDCGCIYVAAYPIFRENEIRLYYLGANGPHSDWREGFFCLATLRPDGFAGYEPTSENVSATIITNPIKFNGEALYVTTDIKDGGNVCVSIVDKHYKELANSDFLDKTVTDGKVIWTENSDFASFKNKEIRLKFALNKAKLYSFSFK